MACHDVSTVDSRFVHSSLSLCGTITKNVSIDATFKCTHRKSCIFTYYMNQSTHSIGFILFSARIPISMAKQLPNLPKTSYMCTRQCRDCHQNGVRLSMALRDACLFSSRGLLVCAARDLIESKRNKNTGLFLRAQKIIAIQTTQYLPRIWSIKLSRSWWWRRPWWWLTIIFLLFIISKLLYPSRLMYKVVSVKVIFFRIVKNRCLFYFVLVLFRRNF